MRIISRTRLREFWESRRERMDAMTPLLQWYDMTHDAAWKTPADVKQVFGKNVDFVQVDSGRTVAIFNIHGNKYRLIAAIHYDYSRVFVLRVLTHAEYDTSKWKRDL